MATKATPKYCACGKRMSQYAQVCNACHKKKMDAIHAEAQAIVRAGKCPFCGSGLRRNSAMAGWWQCEQLGAEHFRARPGDPRCSFQCFTE